MWVCVYACARGSVVCVCVCVCVCVFLVPMAMACGLLVAKQTSLQQSILDASALTHRLFGEKQLKPELNIFFNTCAQRHAYTQMHCGKKQTPTHKGSH